MSQKESVQEFFEKAGTVSMEYLSKLKTKVASTVVDTVYSVENITKSVVPGNPVTREYEITRHVGSAGPGLMWKIYIGYKKSTKQEASIFVLHKKTLDNLSKKERESIIETFKKGATQLARLKHPRILSLQHQLEESKDSLAFATEPCFCSVANLFGNHENMPDPLPKDFEGYKLYDVEIKYGLMQIAEGLAFLHKDVKLIHRNLCPESIVLNSNGAWKLACFELSVTSINDPNESLKFPFKQWDAGQPLVLNPQLDYLAPEYGLASKCDCSSDMFSYGMLFYSLYNNGKPLYRCNSNYSTFMNNIEELRNLKNSQLGGVPNDVKEYLKMLLHINTDLRPDASQVVKIPFFDDVAVKTLEYLDSSFQVENLQKSMFFKGLPQIIDKLPKRVCLQRIIPCLEQEFINPDMIPFVLPNIFLIAHIADNAEFTKYILPKLKPIFKIQKPIQILLIMLHNMNLLLSKTPPTDIKEHILPMVCRALDSETVELQELCLSTLPEFSNLIDIQSIKLSLIPRIRKLVLESSTLSVRVNSLVCIGKLMEHLEKWIVIDDILPILDKINSRESSILMGILGIYKIALTNPKLGITKEILATRILPFLIPLSIDNSLNMTQFNAYFSLIKEMLNQIEQEHRKKIEQIEIMEREKSIIPYQLAITNSQEANKPKSDSTIEQLMIGYGVTKENQTVPAIAAPIAQRIIKKELTLKEKQELAQKLAPPPSTTNGTLTHKLQSSEHHKKDLMSDLFDLNLNQVKSQPNNLALLQSEFSTTPQQQPQIQRFPQQSMNFNQSRPQIQANLSTTNFFGNLSLPPPPAPTTSIRPQIGNNQSQSTSAQKSKSAFDDLADLLG